MQFSVIICTYNRSYNLSKCIAHLAVQEQIKDIEWEIVIVDNNSTDGTDKVIADLTARYNLNIRCVSENCQGLNYARNAGILASSGEYFAFIDDDILVSTNWLRSIYDSLVNNDADAVGGRIHLEKPVFIPLWIKPDMYGFLGHQDMGNVPFRMDGLINYPFGGNMAFNRRVKDKIGLFNTKLGRKGSGRKRDELFKGAEPDYFERLASADGRIFYQPDSLVYHRISSFQLKKRYFRTIHYNEGFQKAFNDQESYNRTLFGVPLFLFPQLARGVKKYLFNMITKGFNWAFRQQMTVFYFLGMINGYAHSRKK